MASRRALRGLTPVVSLLLLGGCGEDPDQPTDDTGFHVATVIPLDEDPAVVESANPELRLSATADPTTCDVDSILLVGVADGNSVVREIDYDLSFPDNGRKIRIEPAGTLANGYWYMITVRSGTWGCTDTTGRMIAPFASRFYVP
jgi:hypothetical protein